MRRLMVSPQDDATLVEVSANPTKANSHGLLRRKHRYNELVNALTPRGRRLSARANMQQNDTIPDEFTPMPAKTLGVGKLPLPAPLPPEAVFLRLMGVDYVRFRAADGGDLYVTEHGMPFLDHLNPQNWYEPEWFKRNRVPLAGSGTVYRLGTRPIPGHPSPSIQLVVKWSRVGQDVPLDTLSLNSAINADFNTPFEEFSLLEELRASRIGPVGFPMLTQRPLAIYIPPERLQLWQTGRSREKIVSKGIQHAGVEIDILRSYIMLYGWIDGIDAVEAQQRHLFDGLVPSEHLKTLTSRILQELNEKGFTVIDHKPTHAIVRIHRGRLVQRKDGQVACAIVDYELLARSPAHELEVKSAARNRYLLLQRDRFEPRGDQATLSPLVRTRILGVDFVYGEAASTGGTLWVVGKDPRLFDYFLPERWRSKKISLSASGRTWYSRTKDGLHLVWKVSRVGDVPSGNVPFRIQETMIEHGYNSPFEKFDLALEMSRNGIPTAYPRAIYVTGASSEVGKTPDGRRFRKFRDILAPDGRPALHEGSDYVTIWGYWRGSEDRDAPNSPIDWSPIGAGQACSMGLLTSTELEQLVKRHHSLLRGAGYEDLSPDFDHVLLSFIPDGAIKRNAGGEIETRHCNFELVRRLC
ncbi:MAG: hypothetical protein ABSB42_22430 [Tepidisphaeraceae bacterium]